MALAKKCDRCGKYYDHYPIDVYADVYNAIRFETKAADGTVIRTGERADLCPECLDELGRFMNKVKEEN